jgi:hypothetical protein
MSRRSGKCIARWQARGHAIIAAGAPAAFAAHLPAGAAALRAPYPYAALALSLDANPFAAFQSWLQGQSDLAPWLGWRERLF